MKLEEALVAIIQGASLGIPGKTLFHSHMPAQVLSGILVLTRVPVVIDPNTGLRKGPFQIICRDQKIDLAHNKASAVIGAIATNGMEIGGVRFLFIKPQHEPLVFPRTEGSQFEAAVNYNFVAYWE